MIELKNTYITVFDGTHRSYGGSQMLSDNRLITQCGCGAVAALDVLLYLDRYHCQCRSYELLSLYSGRDISVEKYHAYLKKLIRRYLPVIPRFGMNGITLSIGMNLFFHHAKMPFRAHWGVPVSRTYETVKQMLSCDIPVILAVGPNFPFFWQKHTAAFYNRADDGSFRASANVKAHFVTATGIDDEWIQISSWGRKYYLNQKEFRDYVKKHSLNYLSSILYIEHK